MGEKVSEAPESVPRGCSAHGARTIVPPAAAASSEGASSAESSSGSETPSEEGDPRRFSRRSQPQPQPQPQPPPGGALGTRLPAAWAPARAALERGVPALPLPPAGGAALPAPRGRSASQEEQDEEVLVEQEMWEQWPRSCTAGSQRRGSPGSPSSGSLHLPFSTAGSPTQGRCADAYCSLSDLFHCVQTYGMRPLCSEDFVRPGRM